MEVDSNTLRPVVSNEENASGSQISPLHIPKNRSTGDLLANASKAMQDRRHRVSVSFHSESNNVRSPIISEHEHGLGVSGLRRIRQHPASRVPSRAPTVPGSPSTPYALPARSSSLNLGHLPPQGFFPAAGSSPSLQVSEDLTRFPSESLHSFSFAHQSEDALHNRNSVLKRAIEFMRDHLGWGASHPGVVSAQAKISGDAELQGMVELLIRAKVMGQDSRRESKSQVINGPLTGPADVDGRNVFEKAFVQMSSSPELKVEHLDIDDELLRLPDDNDISRPSSSQPEPSLGSEISALDVPEPPSPPQSQGPPQRAVLKRTYTDISLLTLQTKLTDAMARPYKATETLSEHPLLSPTPVTPHHSKSRVTGASTPSLVHGHNNRWVPAAQAIFTTQAESPWTVLAANDLACLVFGVTQGEVKKMGMLEVVRPDRRAWLEEKLHSPGSEADTKFRHSQSQSARTSPKTSSGIGGGITASLLSKPSWREQRSQTGGYKNVNRASDTKKSDSRGVLLCGDIVPIQKRNGVTGAASLWVKEKRGGLIWVLEEIAEDVASLRLDEDANIVSTTGATAAIWHETDGLKRKGVAELIPGLPLVDGFAVDKTALERNDDARFYASRTKSGVSVPVSVAMDAGTKTLRVSSFPHIAGIIVLSASTLRIINANSVFSAALFGQGDPSGKSITELIPQFDDIIDFLTEDEKIALVDGIVVPEHSFRRARALLSLREGKVDSSVVFSRPSGLVARHHDGSDINVDLQMRVVRSERVSSSDTVIEEEDASDDEVSELDTSEIVYALWITYSRHLHSASPPGGSASPAISRPASPPHQPSPGQTNRTASPEILEQVEDQPGESPTISQKIEEATSQPISESPPKQAMSEPIPITPSTPIKTPKKRKRISDFVILEDMGQGAYGQVKLARYARSSSKKVVLKYVTKRRILVDTWTRDRRLGTVPLEIHVLDYLRKDGLRHPNIVEMIDFFEDDINYYIEMIPHGLPGMDLFDYIEMRTTMDESECRNIFLQVVEALHHLHTKAMVVHRDIKDENIILDGEGKVKLIDFGSAAYIKSGPFDVFVGTIGTLFSLPHTPALCLYHALSSSLTTCANLVYVDYAAPEVLQGKSYRGKEQDIWALGILLYTLVYKENPFYSIDEILDHELRIPWIMSEANIDLIRAMLDRDVEARTDVIGVMEHEWCREGQGE